MSDPRYPEALEVEGPEWPSVEAERDYWKGLAASYAQTIAAIRQLIVDDVTPPKIAPPLPPCSAHAVEPDSE